MANGLIGKKLGMTRLFTENGTRVTVTVVEAGPCTVVQRKTADKDGYSAIQLGFGELKETKCTKPVSGHFKKAGVSPKRSLREFRIDEAAEFKAGDELRVDIFEKGDKVDVSGTSKGKGFQGVQKRHGFRGGPGGHGSHFHRAPGSVGMSADPSKVQKGKRMPGQMGNRKVTVQGLEVVDVNAEKNLLIIKGAVPGPAGGLVAVQKSVKGRA